MRQSTRQLLVIENPLDVNQLVTMSTASNANDFWTCDSKAVRVTQLSPFMGNVEASFEIEYRPFQLSSTTFATEHLLKISSKELGEYRIKLVLTAQPPATRFCLNFEIALGGQQMEIFSFPVFNKSKCDFLCTSAEKKVGGNGNGVFSHPKSITVDAVSTWEGDLASVNVIFDPTEVGQSSDLLRISHPEGGIYECDLKATCIPPIPQGPFSILPGASVVIPFRNCFATSQVWSFSVDSACFRLQTTSTTVAAKAEGSCTVFYDPSKGQVSGGKIATSMAKLFVICGANPPWIYYLKGVESAAPVGK